MKCALSTYVQGPMFVMSPACGAYGRTERNCVVIHKWSAKKFSSHQCQRNSLPSYFSNSPRTMCFCFEESWVERSINLHTASPDYFVVVKKAPSMKIESFKALSRSTWVRNTSWRRLTVMSRGSAVICGANSGRFNYSNLKTAGLWLGS